MNFINLLNFLNIFFPETKCYGYET